MILIPIKRSFLYLTAVIDWHSRCTVGWEVDDTIIKVLSGAERIVLIEQLLEESEDSNTIKKKLLKYVMPLYLSMKKEKV